MKGSIYKLPITLRWVWLVEVPMWNTLRTTNMELCSTSVLFVLEKFPRTILIYFFFYRDFMNTLKFLNELEVLGMTYSVAAFESAYKSEIVKSLLSFKNPKAVNLAARISRHFNVVNYSLWNEILSKMCTYEMVKSIIHLVFIYKALILKVVIFTPRWRN